MLAPVLLSIADGVTFQLPHYCYQRTNHESENLFSIRKYGLSFGISKPDIALILDKRRVPWHISLMFGQRGVEIGMSVSIDSHALDLAVAGTFVGIKESSELDMSVFADELPLATLQEFQFPR